MCCIQLTSSCATILPLSHCCLSSARSCFPGRAQEPPLHLPSFQRGSCCSLLSPEPLPALPADPAGAAPSLCRARCTARAGNGKPKSENICGHTKAPIKAPAGNSAGDKNKEHPVIYQLRDTPSCSRAPGSCTLILHSFLQHCTNTGWYCFDFEEETSISYKRKGRMTKAEDTVQVLRSDK